MEKQRSLGFRIQVSYLKKVSKAEPRRFLGAVPSDSYDAKSWTLRRSMLLYILLSDDTNDTPE